MIRVNLIGTAKKGGRRRVGGRVSLPQIPNVGILLFLLLLVAEGAGLHLWQTDAANAANKVSTKLALAKMEMASLTKVQADIVELRTEVDKLGAQKTLFDELFANKVGPVNALSYLAFILEPRDEKTTSNDELKAMEAAGWRAGWDARKAWFTGLREESDGSVTLTGEAIDHDDVAEVQRRLESSPYFRETRLVFQERKREDKLLVDFIEFKIKGTLVYMIVPSQPAQPAEPTEAAAGATKGADAGSTSAKTVDAESRPDTGRATGLVPHLERIDAGPPDTGVDTDAAERKPDVDAIAQDKPDVAADVPTAPPPVVPKPAAKTEEARRPESLPTAKEADTPPTAAEGSEAPPANPPPGEKE